MLQEWVSNPGPLTYKSGALPIVLRGPATILGYFPGDNFGIFFIRVLGNMGLWMICQNVFVLFLNEILYCDPSLELSWQGSSNLVCVWGGGGRRGGGHSVWIMLKYGKIMPIYCRPSVAQTLMAIHICSWDDNKKPHSCRHYCISDKFKWFSFLYW